MPIGDKIRNLRKSHGFNQTELGNRLGVKTNAVSKWECGRVEDIPMSKVKAMAALFNVPVSYLIDEGSSNDQSPPADRDILDEIDVAFYGDYKELTDDDKETLRAMARVMRERREKKQLEDPTTEE